MKKKIKEEVLLALGVLLIFFLFFVLLRLHRVIPNNTRKVGGCKGTRYGCCPHSNKSCGNKNCSNC